MEQFSRTAMQLGPDGMNKLHQAKVAVFGVGGVGGYCVEALARSGVGVIDLFDPDKVCLSNINRQIIATHKTVGRYKVDVMKERIGDINPDAEVGAYRLFYSPDTADDVELARYDYVVDAVDTVAAKLELACRCTALDVPVISAMGAGNKLDPTRFEVTDVFRTSECPLARVMRRELRKRGIGALKVVYSAEQPIQNVYFCGNTQGERVPSSNAFVPAAAGLALAGEVILTLAQIAKK